MIIIFAYNIIYLILPLLFVPLIESAPDPLDDLTVNINIGESIPKNGTLPTLNFERRWKTFQANSMQVSEDTVYVVKGGDGGNEFVLYDLEGKFVKNYPGWFQWPRDMTLGGNPSSPHLLVSAMGAEGGNSMVLYDKSGNYVRTFEEEETGLKYPDGLVTSPSGEQIIVTDWRTNRTVIMDVGWIDGTISASSEPSIQVPFPSRVAISGSMSSSVIHRYIVSSYVYGYEDKYNYLSIFDGNKKLIKVVKDLPTGEQLRSPFEVSNDPSGNILLVDFEAMKTHFLDNDGNYIGVIEELGYPNKIVFHKNKVYTLTEEMDHVGRPTYVNVFAYSN